ncbi:MAG: sigma-70 family RNA polymerase sigma factor [Aridibacter sp.]
MSQSHEITLLLQEWGDGNNNVLEDLMPLVYDELHRQATIFLRRERPDHTLQTTALINEAYIKLIDQRDVRFNDRIHFYAISAKLMRRVLVDYARMKNRKKRGGKTIAVSLDETAVVGYNPQNTDIIALDDALKRLEEIDERQTRVVELRYFSGLTLEETAEALKISRSSVAQDWAIAKAWLYRELTK